MQLYQYQQFVEPLDPSLFTSSETVTLDKWWQPAQQPQPDDCLYWLTGNVLVTTSSEVSTAEVRVDAWMQPPQMPEFDLLAREGQWVGVLEPTLLAIPNPDTWFNQTQYDLPPVLPADIPEHPSFFWNPADYTATVPSMDSWFVPPQQPYFADPQTAGWYVYEPPGSLFTDTIPCPWRGPVRELTDDPRPVTDHADEQRPFVNDDFHETPRSRPNECQ